MISRLFRCSTKDSAAGCSAGSDSVPDSGSDCGSSGSGNSAAADSGTGSAGGSGSDSVVDFGSGTDSAADSGSAGSCSAPDSDFDVTSMHSFSPHKAAASLPQPVRHCKRHPFLTARTVLL